MIEALILFTLCLCLVGSAFFSGIETGVISCHRMRLRHAVREGLPGADILEGFARDPDRLLGTTLTGNNFVNVMMSVLAASLGERIAGPVGASCAAVLITILTLIFCEYLPKAWFLARPLGRSLRFARLLKLAERCFRPLSRAAVTVTRWLIPGKSATLAESTPFVTRDDLIALAREGEEHGVLSREERVMIHSVFDLSRKVARDVMVPRAHMQQVAHDATIADILALARTTGLTRLPVFHRERGEYIGVLNVLHVLAHAADNATRTAEWFARPAVFVHERTRVDSILPLMRRRRQPLALVQNDREEIAGLLTTEDVLDEVVGQLAAPGAAAAGTAAQRSTHP